MHAKCDEDLIAAVLPGLWEKLWVYVGNSHAVSNFQLKNSISPSVFYTLAFEKLAQ